MPVNSGRITKAVRRSTRGMKLEQAAVSSRSTTPQPTSPPPQSTSPPPPTKQELDTNRDAIARLSQVALSAEQLQLRETILQFCRTGLQAYATTHRPSVFVIEGDAGTGKSVVLTALFEELQRLARQDSNDDDDDDDDPLSHTHNYLVVNHPEMLKLYHRLAAQSAHTRKADMLRPTTLINDLQKRRATADVVLVDEAHLLLSKKNAYKRFFGDNQLASLLACARVLVIVFDGQQTLRFDAHWTNRALDAILEESTTAAGAGQVARHYLRQQFRVAAAPDVHAWIRALTTDRIVLPRPTTDAQRRAATGDDTAFDFRIYDNAAALYRDLMHRNAQVGGARLLATYDWPYRLPKSGERQRDWFVTCDDDDDSGAGAFRIPWDRYQPQLAAPWSEQPDSHRYCGSVYTIQGFDLSYAGVLLGPSVGYDPHTDRVVVHPEHCHDSGAFMGRKNDATADDAKAELVLHAVNVLLTRGVHGCYVYAVDEALRKKLLSC